MLKNTILALIALMTFSVGAADVATTNGLPANTITISAVVDKKDFVSIQGNNVWFAHINGEYPSDIYVNGNPWTPTWDEEESDVFTMKNPPRFLPMTGKRGLLSVSFAKTNGVLSVIEYPDTANDWIMVMLLKNTNATGPTRMNVTISWEDDMTPIIVPSTSVTHRRPNPTPTGLN